MRKSKCFLVVLALSGVSRGSCDDTDDRRGAARTATEPAQVAQRDTSSSDASKSKPTDSQNGLAREMAKIAHAKPEPEPNFENEEKRVREEFRNSKKVRSGHGWVYVPRDPKPIRRTATAAVGGCDNRTYGSRGAQKTLPVPQPPGVTAKRLGPTKVLVTYRIGEGNEDCRARWLDLRADVSADLSGAIGKQYPIKHPSGQIVVHLAGPVADADVLSASAWTKHLSGQSSRGTTIRIR
jgi:hypothetical protein